MQSLELLKRRIRTAEDLQSVVRTMKALAAVSARQYDRAVASLAEYTRTVELGARMLLFSHQELRSLQATESSPHVGMIVFGSDQGMCGRFNEAIVEFALEQIAGSTAAAGGTLRSLCVGVRAGDRLLDKRIQIDEVFSCPGTVAGITPAVQDLLPFIDDWRSRYHLGRIELFYQRRYSESSIAPSRITLLPFDVERLDQLRVRRWDSRSLPLAAGEGNRLLTSVIRQYLFIELFRAFAESQASENSSRMASLHQAEQSIDRRLGEFRSTFQQARQTAITEELLDVVTGFEALMTKRK